MGAGLPDKVFELQHQALTPTVKLLRPYINKYMGGFADHNKEVDENFFAKDTEPELECGRADSTGLCKEVLGSGDVVIIQDMPQFDSHVVGTILAESGGKCTVKFFNPETGDVEQLNDVPK